MTLSIVLVNYRGWKQLRPCLESLRFLKQASFQWEVIIVDNQSDDGQLLTFIEEFPEFTFVENTGNHGFANGCNTGARQTSGKFILFLNPDTQIQLNALVHLLKIAEEHPEFTILSCRQVNDQGEDTKPYGYFPRLATLTSFTRVFYRLLHKPLAVQTLSSGYTALFPEWVSGSLILISRKKFNSLKGWDEDFWMYYEDADLCKRVRNSGGEIGLLNDVEIIHNHGGASRVNPYVKALTKTEVMISKHVYLHKHFHGFKRSYLQFILVFNNLLFIPLITALAGWLFWFKPSLYVYAKRYSNLLGYYIGVFTHKTWISPRSVNFKTNG